MSSSVTSLPPLMPRRRDEAMVADFDTELVVVVPEARLAHLLDEGLSLVLDSCDGATPTAAVVAEVVEATGEDPAAVERWLADCLRQLIELDIVVASDVEG